MSNEHREQAREMPPDISHKDSARLSGFVRMTSVEIKAVGGVGAATSLEMIGYIRELERALSSRDAEIREVLEGLSINMHYANGSVRCWCHSRDGLHTPACLAARALWEKVQER